MSRVLAVIGLLIAFFILFECSQSSLSLMSDITSEAAARRLRLIPGE
jgi:hypothetical protein